MKTVTLKEIVYNIKNSANRGQQTDDVKFSNRQLVFIVNHFREKLAMQRLNAGKDPGNFAQPLKDVKFEKTKDYISPEGFTILRSSKQIPTPITLDVGDGITRVGTKDGLMPYVRTYVDIAHLSSQARYTKYMSRYFYDNGYIYVICPDKPGLRELQVTGVFSNPDSVEEFNNGVDPFRGMDYEYPIPLGMLDQLNALIMNNEYRWAEMMPGDVINDGKDE